MKTECLPVVVVSLACALAVQVSGGTVESALVVPASKQPLHLAVALPPGAAGEASVDWLLVEPGFDAEPVSVDLQTLSTPTGLAGGPARLLLANIPRRQLLSGPERTLAAPPARAV